MYRINKQSFRNKTNKLPVLLGQSQKLFHTNDLALLWGINNKNTLYTTIKRYVKKKILIPIHKGFYATLEADKIDPLKLGIAFLHQFAYLSTETVLVKEGIIFQNIPCLTLVSAVSKQFKIGDNLYKVRQMKDEFLYQDAGIVIKNGLRQAGVERAVADLLYFNPNYHFDGAKFVDWDRVKKIQQKVGFK